MQVLISGIVIKMVIIDPGLTKFTSYFFGAGFRFAPPKNILGINHLSTLELRYGHYNRTNALNSDIISLNLKFK